MRFVKNFLLIIMLLYLLCSCSERGNRMECYISSSDKTLIDLASTTYSDSQLTRIVSYSGSINELNDMFPIECLREVEDTYRVSYLGEQRVAVIVFDKDGNRILGNTHSAMQSKSDFNKLRNGQSIEDVKAIDPEGEYLFLYTGRDDTPRVSTHYTTDGYLITIEYDDSNKIINIKECLI